MSRVAEITGSGLYDPNMTSKQASNLVEELERANDLDNLSEEPWLEFLEEEQVITMEQEQNPTKSNPKSRPNTSGPTIDEKIKIKKGLKVLNDSNNADEVIQGITAIDPEFGILLDILYEISNSVKKGLKFVLKDRTGSLKDIEDPTLNKYVKITDRLSGRSTYVPFENNIINEIANALGVEDINNLFNNKFGLGSHDQQVVSMTKGQYQDYYNKEYKRNYEQRYHNRQVDVMQAHLDRYDSGPDSEKTPSRDAYFKQIRDDLYNSKNKVFNSVDTTIAGPKRDPLPTIFNNFNNKEAAGPTTQGPRPIITSEEGPRPIPRIEIPRDPVQKVFNGQDTTISVPRPSRPTLNISSNGPISRYAHDKVAPVPTSVANDYSADMAKMFQMLSDIKSGMSSQSSLKNLRFVES